MLGAGTRDILELWKSSASSKAIFWFSLCKRLANIVVQNWDWRSLLLKVRHSGNNKGHFPCRGNQLDGYWSDVLLGVEGIDIKPLDHIG